jgi:hypothetical protein
MARVAHLPGRGPATGRPLVLLWLAAAACAGGILACLRSGWTDETVRDGLSWFGARPEAFLPFATGMLATAVLLGWAAASLPPGLGATRAALALSAVLLTGVVATPYTAGPVLYAVHDSLAAALFLVQLGWVLWSGRRLGGPGPAVAAAVMTVAGLAGLASLLNLVEVLLWAQLAFQLAFAVQAPVAVGALLATSRPVTSTGSRGIP